jgi:hypothetical protein
LRQGSGSGNDQYIPYPGKHERRERIINHGLVIYRKKLLADSLGYRIKPGAVTSC